MSTVRFEVNNPNMGKDEADKRFANSVAQDRHKAVEKVYKYFQALVSGNAFGSGSIITTRVNDDFTSATGTVTLASASAADTVTAGNIVFTAVSGTPSGNQFKVGVSNTADGASLAAAINANTSLNPYLTAVNAAGVVTITINQGFGALGNAVQLSSSNNTRLAVVALASGADGTAYTYNF